MYLNKEQIQLYLDKLQINKPIELTSDFLSELQIAHLKNIPYENIDILNKKPLSLEINDLFDKLIIQNRGGYCFETNTLFAALLRSLGYEVTSFTGRYIPNDIVLQMRRHRILKVTMNEGEFICDVGVRVELSRKALKLVLDEVQFDGISEYRFSYDSFHGYILWQKPYERQWKKIYGFCELEQAEIDYIMPSFFCELHPTSPFINNLYLAVFSDNTHITLTNNVYKVYSNGRVVKREVIDSKIEILEKTKKIFKIEISDIDITNIKLDI